MNLINIINEEISKIVENPDFVTYNNKNLDYQTYGSIAFGFVNINGSLNVLLASDEDDFIPPDNYYQRDTYEATHYQMSNFAANKDILKNTNVGKITRHTMLFSGRMWTVEKIISFWYYPTPAELKSLLVILKKRIEDYFEIPINWSEYYINTPNNELIPLKNYTNNNDKWSDDELAKQHVDPKQRNQKRERILNDKNFKGGSRAMQAKYPNAKPEEIMAWNMKKNLDETLNEDYESIRIIDSLVTQLIKKLTEEMIDNRSVNVYAKLNEVAGNFKNSKLYNFIKYGNVIVKLGQASYRENSETGKIETNSGAYYDNTNKEVVLLANIEKFQPYLFSKTDKITKWKFLFDKFNTNKVRENFVHEIQHAYDMYRSHDKAKDKNTNTVLSRLDNAKKSNDHSEIKNIRPDYLNLSHEIWARFSELFTNYLPVKKLDNNQYAMIPLNLYINVLSRMDGYDNLKPEVKKRLQRALSQYWYKMQDELPQINKRGYIDIPANRI